MVGCSVTGCTFNTDTQVPGDTALTDKIKLLEIHAMSVHQSNTDYVAAFHPSIYTVQLHNAKQVEDEQVKAFAGRVHNISRKCSLQKRCQCGIQVSFRKETVYHVVLDGLRDKELQKACTNEASLNNIRDITTLLDFCTSKESNQTSACDIFGGIRSYNSTKKFHQKSIVPTNSKTPLSYWLYRNEPF